MAGPQKERRSRRTKEWNSDPAWVERIQQFEPIIKAIATKYCSDEDMRQDCEQEARIALLTVLPERIRGYQRYVDGEISEDEWAYRLARYCHNVIRNSILSYLDKYPTGNWYIGRTRRVVDPETGELKRIHLPPRYSSLDELMEEYALEIDEEGNLSWARVSVDGIEL